MKLSQQFKINVRKVALITLGYVLINIHNFFYNYALIQSPYSLGPSPLFIPKAGILSSITIGIVSGMLVGVLLVWVNSQLFRKKSFKFAMLTTFLAYVVIFIIATLISSFSLIIADKGLAGVSYDSMIKSLAPLFGLSITTFFIMWGAIILFTLFLLQVSDKFGPGVFFKFLAGNYHSPKKEGRIFMFLDMRSSTSIAEKIGNEKYFNLLKDVFYDITDTILNNEGEIYQYVGDEIVISWSTKKGSRNANCLNCFTQIQKKLIELRLIYEQKYNVLPEFKAGIHYGTVMAGEVGVIKKDIIYSGDVLNTTARIQEQCNKYGVDVLISKETFDLISGTEDYTLIPIGSIELRGKKRKINISTIREI